MKTTSAIITLIITSVLISAKALFPDHTFFFHHASVLINTLFLFSIAHLCIGGVYRNNEKDYSNARHIALSCIATIPFLAIIFMPSLIFPYIVGKAFAFRTLALILLASFTYLIITNKTYRLVQTPFAKAMGVFLLVIAITNLFSVDPYKSFWGNYERMEGYIGLLSVAIVALAIPTLRIKDIEWKRVFQIHVWVAGIVSFIGFSQYIVGILQIKALSTLPFVDICFKNPSCKVDSTMGNSIYLGIYAALNMWLFAYVYMMQRSKGLKNKTQLRLLALITISQAVLVFLSGARGVMLGCAVGALVAILYTFWKQGKEGKKRLIYAIVAGLILFISGFASLRYINTHKLYQNSPLVQKLTSVSSLSARFVTWKIALVSFEDKPVFGWGQESFTHAFNLHFDPRMQGQESFFDHPHNTYLDWLVAGGLLGLLAYLYMLYRAIVSAMHKKEGIILGLCIMYLTHLFFVFDTLLSILFFVLLVSYFSRRYEEKDAPIFSKYIKIIPKEHNEATILLLAVVMGGAWYCSVYQPVFANGTVIQAMQNAVSGKQDTIDARINTTRTIYEKALETYTFGTYELNEFFVQDAFSFVQKYGTIINNEKDIRSTTALTDFLEAALSRMEKQSADRPYDHRAMFSLGLNYLNLRKNDQAVQTLEKAAALAPDKQLALTYLGKAYLAKGDILQGLKAYEKALNTTTKDLPGYNDMNMEYINILLSNNQKEAVNDLALNRIWTLNPMQSINDMDVVIPKILKVYSTTKDMEGFARRLTYARSIDPTSANLIVWQASLYLFQQNNAKAGEVMRLLPADKQSITEEFLKRITPVK